jgi:hypothetical protein
MLGKLPEERPPLFIKIITIKINRLIGEKTNNK